MDEGWKAHYAPSTSSLIAFYSILLFSPSLISSNVIPSAFLFSLSWNFPITSSLALPSAKLCSLLIPHTFPYPFLLHSPLLSPPLLSPPLLSPPLLSPPLLSPPLLSHIWLHIFNILWLTLRHFRKPLHITSYNTGSPRRSDWYKHRTGHTA